MPDTATFRFGPYLVIPERREVLFQGRARPISPKAFDVLVYLIENRDRVVSREELLKKVWKGRIVVENAVARTIMQTREALGDVGDNPRIIRTVQRAGYRFVADLDRPADSVWPPDVGQRAGTSVPTTSLKLGFLPFINQTGDLKLAWVELGLLSLVVQSLSKDPRMSIPSTASVLICTENLNRDLSESQKATKLMDMLGAMVVISASISKSGDQFIMAYQTFGRNDAEIQGVLTGPELTQLALHLAREVEEKLFPDNSRGISVQSDSSFVNECYSRGMEASDARRWQSASRYFSVVCMMEPELMDARLEYLYALARIPDPSAVQQAEALIADAREIDDLVCEARATYVLALAHAELGMNRTVALEIVNRALGIAPPNIGAEWFIRACLLRSYATAYHDYRAKSEAIDQAYRACEMYGNRVALLMVLTNRGAFESELGNISASYETAQEVIELSEKLNKPPYMAIANCSFSEFVLGQFDKSLASSDAFVELCAEAEDRPFISIRLAVAAAFSRACDLRETERLVNWKKKFVPILKAPENTAARGLDCYRDGSIEQSKGHLDSACRLLAEAGEFLDDKRHYREMSLLLLDLILNYLRLGKSEEADKERRRLADYDEVKNDRSIRPAIFHLESLHAWLNGDQSLALERIEQALAIPFTSRWNAYLRIDLAWHHLLHGNLERAETILDPIKPWIDRHPAGLVTGAMLAFRRGDLLLALDRHRRHTKLAGGSEMTRFGPLNSFYEGMASKCKSPEAFLDEMLLPSLYWVSISNGSSQATEY